MSSTKVLLMLFAWVSTLALLAALLCPLAGPVPQVGSPTPTPAWMTAVTWGLPSAYWTTPPLGDRWLPHTSRGFGSQFPPL